MNEHAELRRCVRKLGCDILIDALVSINRRLSPATSFDTAIQQINELVEYVKLAQKSIVGSAKFRLGVRAILHFIAGEITPVTSSHFAEHFSGDRGVEAIALVLNRVREGQQRQIKMAIAELKAIRDELNHPSTVSRPAERKPAKHVRINAQMLETLTRNIDAKGWTITQWCKQLHCAKSSIHDAPTWKMLENARLDAKAKRIGDRHRKPKASDMKRD